MGMGTLLNSSAMVCGFEILVSFITNVEGKLFDFFLFVD